MRFAYVAAHIPRRRELASGPIDAEWIADERGPAEVVVFADYESEGTDLLKDAGFTVFVSAKRPVLFAEGEYETAEQLQARILLELHLEEPFDAIVYDSAQSTDWAWHQARLESVPRGVALGPGPVRDIRMVASAPELVAAHGRKLWALTGALTSADFLVSDVGAEAYGLDQGRLPPRYSIRDLPTATPTAGIAAMIGLVGLSEDAAGLASLVSRTLEQVASDENTIIAILHPDIATGPETTRDILLSGVPAHLRDRLRVAEPSSDGVAERLLTQADVIVAARPSDLAVPAVADAAAKVGSLVLSGAPSPATRLLDATLAKAEHRRPRLVAVDRPLDELVPIIDELAGDSAAVVLHTPEAAGLAQRLWRLPGTSRAGLVLVCDAGRYLGEADPARPARNVIGFAIETWPSIRRLLAHAHTLHDLIEAAVNLAHADRTDLLTVPVLGAGQAAHVSEASSLPAWVTDGGSLPAMHYSGPAEPASPPTEHQHSAGQAGIKHWAETHGFKDRIRLALPWKWGLLNRAMRNRW